MDSATPGCGERWSTTSLSAGVDTPSTWYELGGVMPYASYDSGITTVGSKYHRPMGIPSESVPPTLSR